ncbi:MAG: hypothetical protein GX795_12390 [Firmicutes bacterium]|jgi:hypothetical protein|nr:hypothetical protein [Bacillota bacterium]
MSGNNDQRITGDSDPDRMHAQNFDGTTVHLILNTLTQVFNSEHRRIRTIEGKAGMLLSSSGIFVGLLGRGLVTLLSTMPWALVPCVIAVISLGIGMVFALKVIDISEYERIDTEALFEEGVIDLAPEDCVTRLSATWHKTVVSIEAVAKEKIRWYTWAQRCVTLSIVIVLIVLLATMDTIRFSPNSLKLPR